MKWRRWSENELSPLGESGAGGDERGSLPRATRGCVVLNSPSQTGKVSGLKYLCRTDRVDYSLGFIYGSASEARLYGVLIKELIDKKAYLGIFAALRKQQAKTFTTAAMLQELHLSPWLRQDLLLRSKVNTLKPAFG